MDTRFSYAFLALTVIGLILTIAGFYSMAMRLGFDFFFFIGAVATVVGILLIHLDLHGFEFTK